MNDWDIHRVSCSMDQLRRSQISDDGKKMRAFPHVGGMGGDKGMTLRDYFAAKTMQALISTGKSFEDVRVIAIAAYEMADLMMGERYK